MVSYVVLTFRSSTVPPFSEILWAHILIYLLTYLLKYLVHGAESFLRS